MHPGEAMCMNESDGGTARVANRWHLGRYVAGAGERLDGWIAGRFACTDVR